MAEDEETAIAAVKDMLEEGSFGQAGAEIIIEEFLQGEEVSILAFTDGKTVIPMVSAQDHKRVLDGDKGPNTGGMGAYSPAPIYTPQMASMVQTEVLQATVDAMRAEGCPYQGVLYAGLMVTQDGVKVLEFNARFGDPETQPVLMRLETDLVDIIQAILNGDLAQQKIVWRPEAAVCVVMASGGYPGHYVKGYPIAGLMEAAKRAGLPCRHRGKERPNRNCRRPRFGSHCPGANNWGSDRCCLCVCRENLVSRCHLPPGHRLSGLKKVTPACLLKPLYNSVFFMPY